MSAHMPGSWTIQEDEAPWTEGDAQTAVESNEELGPVEIMFDIQDASGNVVARIPWAPIAPDADQECIRRNARLIAAAPELLVELERLVEFATPYYGIPLNKARAAIRAAKGD